MNAKSNLLWSQCSQVSSNVLLRAYCRGEVRSDCKYSQMLSRCCVLASTLRVLLQFFPLEKFETVREMCDDIHNVALDFQPKCILIVSQRKRLCTRYEVDNPFYHILNYWNEWSYTKVHILK